MDNIAENIEEQCFEIIPLEDEDDIEVAERFLAYDDTDEEKRQYLEELLPNLSREDVSTCLGYIYKCRFCGRHYPIWWISNEDWRESFGVLEKVVAAVLDQTVEEMKLYGPMGWGLHVCKECFERVTPNPNYFTIDEYVTVRLIGECELEEEWRAGLERILGKIWDLPPR